MGGWMRCHNFEQNLLHKFLWIISEQCPWGEWLVKLQVCICVWMMCVCIHLVVTYSRKGTTLQQPSTTTSVSRYLLSAVRSLSSLQFTTVTMFRLADFSTCEEHVLFSLLPSCSTNLLTSAPPYTLILLMWIFIIITFIAFIGSLSMLKLIRQLWSSILWALFSP